MSYYHLWVLFHKLVGMVEDQLCIHLLQLHNRKGLVVDRVVARLVADKGSALDKEVGELVEGKIVVGMEVVVGREVAVADRS
uniref:Uncharacterized protein n=1 Tax=Ditylenchus dipsaci TaxID=166011 RepID=A0A915DD10_9BILA